MNNIEPSALVGMMSLLLNAASEPDFSSLVKRLRLSVKSLDGRIWYLIKTVLEFLKDGFYRFFFRYNINSFMRTCESGNDLNISLGQVKDLGKIPDEVLICFAVNRRCFNFNTQGTIRIKGCFVNFTAWFYKAIDLHIGFLILVKVEIFLEG